jgi:hypothetical protein
MPSWAVSVIETFTISTFSGCAFLWLRCRRTGHPFGPSAKWWASAVILITAAASTGIGMAAVVASDHVRAAYLGLIVPGGLWVTAASTQRSRDRGSAVLIRISMCLTLPLSRLTDRMGDDMQAWCETRMRAVSQKPQSVAEAAQYYYAQVSGKVRDTRTLAELARSRDSIAHKIAVIRLIGLDTTLERIHAELQHHPATMHLRRFSATDLPRLAERLEIEAKNELYLFLAYLYRLGHHKLLIYPFRAEMYAHPRHDPRPLTGPGATTD